MNTLSHPLLNCDRRQLVKMGSFVGHVLPGTFFFLFGLWWCIQIYQRYYESLCRQGRRYRNTVYFPVTSCNRTVNLEAIIAIVLCAIGMTVELIISPVFHRSPLGMNSLQHATMYFFFMQVAILSLLGKRIRLLPNVEDILYLALALAFIAEGCMFKFHLGGRSDVDVILHTLLVYVIYASVASTLLEMRYRGSMLLALCRAFSTILHGTWFWQMGFFLYNPLASHAWSGPYDMQHDGGELKLDPSEEKAMHEQMLFMACTFAWHMAVAFLLVLITGTVIGCFYKPEDPSQEIGLLSHKNNKGGFAGGYTMLQEQDDDDEGV